VVECVVNVGNTVRSSRRGLALYYFKADNFGGSLILVASERKKEEAPMSPCSKTRRTRVLETGNFLGSV
jgi:hypothetical protein